MSISRPPRVAIVGAGPAGLYAAAHLIERRGDPIEIDLYEKLPTPWGLVRAGVAPDHPEKKLIIDRQFDFYLRNPRLRFIGNVEIGVDIPHDELKRWYDAVIYAVGASSDVRAGIAGEDLAGSWSAREFVGFYNGHPDHAGLRFDLSGDRAVIIGNGNVALDVARILTAPIHELDCTDIANGALDLLRGSRIEEVVILARRGPAQAACNNPELEELGRLEGVDISVEGVNAAQLAALAKDERDWQVRRKLETLRRLTGRSRTPGNKHIVLRFFASPIALLGTEKVERVRVALTDPGAAAPRDVAASDRLEEEIETGLLLRAIGYRGTAFPGLPYDSARGVIANIHGRVCDAAGILPGVYVTGWIKRGCRGIIGSNKKCARETIQHLLDDLAAGALPRTIMDGAAVLAALHRREIRPVSLAQWSQIDRCERDEGRRQARPRVKLAERDSLLHTAFSPSIEEALA